LKDDIVANYKSMKVLKALYSRFIDLATTAVVPLPENGSYTNSAFVDLLFFRLKLRKMVLDGNYSFIVSSHTLLMGVCFLEL